MAHGARMRRRREDPRKDGSRQDPRVRQSLHQVLLVGHRGSPRQRDLDDVRRYRYRVVDFVPSCLDHLWQHRHPRQHDPGLDDSRRIQVDCRWRRTRWSGWNIARPQHGHRGGNCRSLCHRRVEWSREEAGRRNRCRSVGDGDGRGLVRSRGK